MKKVYVIIKHPYRDLDWRIDIIEVDESWTYDDIVAQIEYEMLGPFEVMGLSTRVSERKFPSLKRLEKLNSKQNVQVSDTTGDDSSTGDCK